MSGSPWLVLAAPPFSLLTTLPVSEAPAGAGVERGGRRSTGSRALPRPLCLPGCLVRAKARGAKTGLEGAGVSVVGVLGRSGVLRLARRFPKCAAEGGFGAGFGRSPWPWVLD